LQAFAHLAALNQNMLVMNEQAGQQRVVFACRALGDFVFVMGKN